MKSVALPAAIQEIDDDLVANLRTNDWPKNSQPLRLWLLYGEARVRVFDKPGFRAFQPHAPGLRNRAAVYQIASAWGIVPHHVFRSDVVMTGCRETGWRKEKKKTHPEPLPDFHEGIIPL